VIKITNHCADNNATSRNDIDHILLKSSVLSTTDKSYHRTPFHGQHSETTLGKRALNRDNSPYVFLTLCGWRRCASITIYHWTRYEYNIMLTNNPVKTSKSHRYENKFVY